MDRPSWGPCLHASPYEADPHRADLGLQSDGGARSGCSCSYSGHQHALPDSARRSESALPRRSKSRRSWSALHARGEQQDVQSASAAPLRRR